MKAVTDPLWPRRRQAVAGLRRPCDRQPTWWRGRCSSRCR
jgi:hypothetical protein